MARCRFLAALIGCLFVLSGLYDVPALAAGTVRITGVQVTPDLRRILVKCDGPVGKHSAFAMQSPSRLVVDFDDTDLGDAPRRLKVGRAPIDEIRLGHAGSRSRLVVDFGAHPVPTFKVHQQGNVAVLALEQRAGSADPAASESPVSPARTSSVRPAVSIRTPQTPQAPQVTPLRRTEVPDRGSAKDGAPAFTIRTGTTEGNRISIELTDKKDPKKTCKLLLDVDPVALSLRRASLSGSDGQTKRFDLVTASAGPESPVAKSQSVAGPRREAAGPTASENRSVKYQWGLPKPEVFPGVKAVAGQASPFRAEAAPASD